MLRNNSCLRFQTWTLTLCSTITMMVTVLCFTSFTQQTSAFLLHHNIPIPPNPNTAAAKATSKTTAAESAAIVSKYEHMMHNVIHSATSNGIYMPMKIGYMTTSTLKSKENNEIEQEHEHDEHEKKNQRNRNATSTSSDSGDPNNLNLENFQLYRKPKQIRRRPKSPKRPPTYWSNITNLEIELRSFWVQSLNIPLSIVPSDTPPPIPNETLLNYYERHDLRYAIAKLGGRNSTSALLGGARLIPGKWNEAVKTSKEVQYLLKGDNPAGKGLRKDVPPIARHKKKMLVKGEVGRVKRRMHDVILNSFLLNDDSDGNSDKLGDRNGAGDGTGDGDGDQDFDRDDEIYCEKDGTQTEYSEECVIVNHQSASSSTSSASSSNIPIPSSKQNFQTQSKTSNPEVGAGAGAGAGVEIDVGDIFSEVAQMKIEMNEDTIRNLRYPAGERWAQMEDRKPRGYWDQDVLVHELYDYLTCTHKSKNRPKIWMPRPSEISDEGRSDLRQAIARFGGTDYICGIAGLVPYKQWLYFEEQLELFVELQGYLNKYGHESTLKKGNGKSGKNKHFFPKLSDIRNNGHDRLHDLIMNFGGRKMIAIKLDMEYQAQTKVKIFQGMSYGKFDLMFAIRLLHFMRKEMMMIECDLDLSTEADKDQRQQQEEVEKPSSTTVSKKKPCTGHIYMQMPTEQILIQRGETELITEIRKYGGHESIARNLQLGFNLEEAMRDSAERRKG